ncbi:TadE/TadG family type IV pilus assembly protein [Tautonia sociabilis]|nr:TadE/TadG family type IV pilus assembly protein [Tautonia sociabilis]
MRAEPGAARTRRRGATVVETAIVLNIALMLILGVFESGCLLMTTPLLDNAARAAARQAASGTYGTTEQEIREAAERLLVGTRFEEPPEILIYRIDTDGNPDGHWTDSAFGEGIAVQINARYTPIVPTFGIVPDPIPLSSRSIARSEGD